LARAHELTLAKTPGASPPAEPSTTLHALIKTIIAPYDDMSPSGSRRMTIGGCDIPLSAEALTSFALLLYEFATNAAKYGALSTPDGRIDIECSEDGPQVLLTWSERGSPPPVEQADEGEGYGSLLGRATVKGQFGGEIEREWTPEGLIIRLSILRERLTG
jgi:two-component sensor histidine kinase